jgi:hypothetical protein
VETFWDRMKKEHGRCIQVGNDCHWIYEDGTVIRGREIPQIFEPPGDKLGNLRARRGYVEAQLKIEVAEFYKYRNEYLRDAQMHMASPAFVPSVPPEAVESLKAGKARILKLQEQLNKIDAKLPDQKHQQENAQRAQERDMEAMQRRLEIESVQL